MRVGIVFVISLLIVDEIRAIKSYAYAKLVLEPRARAAAQEMQTGLLEFQRNMLELSESLGAR